MKRAASIIAVVLSVGCAVAGWRGRFDEQFAASVADAEWTPAALNPVAWYQAEDNALDSAGANDGTWSGTAAYKTGMAGNAFSFNGTASINIGTTAVYRAVSMAMWFYPATVPGAGNQHVGALLKVGFRTGGSNRVGWNVWDQNNNRFELNPNSASETNKWAFFCGTWDGTTSTIYVDGSFSASVAVSGTSLGSLGSSLAIGPSKNGNIIDDVLIFDRALTPDEIKKLYDESVKRNGRAWK